MSNGFVHSIPVPRLYKTAAKTVRQVTEEGASLKQLIYEKKHPNLKGVYALATTTLHNAGKLNQIIRHTQLLFKEPRFDPWLARVLITELIWGKGAVNNDSKPVQTILTYENDIREYLQNSTPVSTDEEPKKKAQKPRYIRINTLVKSVEDAIEGFKEDGYDLLPKPKTYGEFLESVRNLATRPFLVFIQDFHVEELFAFPSGTHFYNHPGYQCGAIVLQDKASCLPAYLLNPEPCSVVLDMCAAPGMKTTHLAAILHNRGKVFSVERNERRYQVLCEMVNNANAECVTTLNQDALTLTPETCADVKYILVDPSCSGSGMDRPEFEDNQGRCAPGRLKRLQSFQVLLLRHALLSFPTVKRVVYSTCSMYPEENEMVVDEILRDIGAAYKLVPTKHLLKNQWINFSSKDYECGDNCLYAKPDIDYSNGFFVAVFERNSEVPLPDRQKKKPVNVNFTNNAGEVVNGDETNENWRDKKCKKKRKSRRDSEVEDDDHMKTNNFDECLKNKIMSETKISKEDERQEEITKDVIVTQDLLSEEIPEKKRRKKHKKDKVREEINPLDVGNNGNNDAGIVDESEEFEKKKKKKKKKQDKKETESVEFESTVNDTNSSHEIYVDDRTNDPESKKKKKRKRRQEKESAECGVTSDAQTKNSEVTEEMAEDSPKKKKKKKEEM